jgi:hypothetical protein
VPDLKGEHRIDGYFYLKALPVPGRGAPDEYRAVLQNFKTALSHKFEDFDMNGAQTWPWQQDRFGGEDFCLTKKALKTLLARTPVSHLPLEKNYEGDFYIAAEPLANVPYVASIHKAQRQIQAKYLQDHEAEVRALPWMPGIADSLDDFGALRLYRADLNNGQLALALDMESRGCLRDHIKEYWNPAGIPMRQFLETEFEARVKHMIEIIAHCPWQHSRDGIVFIPDTANLLNEQADILSRLYLTDKFDAHVEREGGRQGSGWKARNTLRTRIAEVMCENAVVTKIPGDVLALPWEFDDDDIILRDRNVRPEQFMRAQQALPWCKPGSDTDFDDFSMEKHRKFQIASPEAYDVGRRFLEAPYYQQLMPAALRSLTKTMQEVVKMPWGKSGEIYERALSPEQQKILNKTPRQIVNWRCRSIHSNERIYTLAVPAGAKPQLAAPLAPVMQHP